ncbi:MAG: histidine kinase, partial [Gramella sp.]|nr:histidine kinase [Christiangramia sp.]
STRFFSVLQDRDGNFWFSSIGSGVYFYDGNDFKNFTVQEGLPDNRVTHIYEDGKGNIWFGTEGGLSMYDGQYFKNFTKKDGLPHDDVSSIIEDHSGKIWFGTRNGICYYDGSTITVLSNRGKKFANVRSIIQDINDRIWFGGNDGLWNYDGTNFLKLSDNFVGYISEDKSGNIWTSSESSQGQGWEIFRYDQEVVAKGKSNFTQIVSSSEMIFGHLIDNEGNLWFGALGVYKYDGSSVISFKKPDIKI